MNNRMNFWLAALAAGMCSLQAAAALTVVDLRCEGRRDPIGVADAVPRLTWRYEGEEPSARPAGAEVRLAASREDVMAGRNVTWTRRTASSDIFSCLYNGPALAAGTPYWWQARLVFSDGSSTPWSEPARFTVALQDPEAWGGAKWIGETASRVEWDDFDYQVKVSAVTNAVGLLFRANDDGDGYMWQINTEGPVPRLRPHIFKKRKFVGGLSVRELPMFDTAKEHAVRISVRGPKIRTFIDGTLVDEQRDATFASGTIGLRTSHNESALVSELSVHDAKGGTLLFDRFRGHVMPAFNNPRVVGNKLDVRRGAVLLHAAQIPKSCPRLRKTFKLRDKPVRHAYASACGYGFYELWLNGRPVDPSRTLAPAMSNPSRAALFDTYDVTALLKPGAANTAGFMLAAGYSDDFSRYGWHWLKPKSAIMHLAVTYEDGEREVVVTDGTWSLNPESEVVSASIYHGETLDAVRRDAEWCTPRGATNGWRAVDAHPIDFTAPLRASVTPPVRRSDPRRPVSIKETKPGVFTVDFGQNRAGVVEVRVKGPKGTRIKLHTSEIMGKDGSIDPWTNAAAKSEDTFVLAGTGDVETFLPRFTYHGFQYVEITGWPGRPTEDDLVAWAVHADVEPRCKFRCSNEGINRIDNAARWSMLSNFMGYPTDCCMRAERTPCQMDSQVYEDAALLYFNMTGFYAKWLDDIRGGRGNPDWTGDSATLPWRIWLDTGDARVLARSYEDIKGQVDAYVKNHPDLICETGFGDWCAPNEGTWESYFNDVGVVNTAVFCEMARVASDTAELLWRTGEAAEYRRLYERAKAAFHAKFYDAGKSAYGDGSQTTAVLPLAFGIVPSGCRRAVEEAFVKRIRTVDKSRVDTGIYGTRYLGDVLCDMGEADLLVHLFTQPEYPGFGYMFANGATTLWEQWSFRCGMNSHNHAMFSGAAHTLVTRLGGIRAAAPGYAEVEIRPVFPSGMDFVEVVRMTPRGEVSVRWRRVGGAVEVETKVPPFTPATLALPGRAPVALAAGAASTRYSP